MRTISLALALSGFVMIWVAVHTLAATAHRGYYQRVALEAIEHNVQGNDRPSQTIKLLVDRNEYFSSQMFDASMVLGVSGLANVLVSLLVLHFAPRRTEQRSR
jgi:hypothetical protein